MNAPALRVTGLKAWYGESEALHGIDLEVASGEMVALLGRNGAGRTTVLRAAMSLARRTAVRAEVFGRDTLSMPTFAIARLGVGYCPEERAIYASLTCEENLMLPPTVAPGGMALERIYELFPNLYERRRSFGAKLSGGEQQMLAIARILRTGARLLLLDEISEGLAPAIVKSLAQTVRSLKRDGYTIVLVEQNFHFAAPLADRYYVLENGRVAMEGDAAGMPAQEASIRSLIGV
jgi:branched-chain amino acid transport system ATP-binding protein